MPTKLHKLQITDVQITSKTEFYETTEEVTLKLEPKPTTSSLAFETEVKIEQNSSSEECENDSSLGITEDIKNDTKRKRCKQSNEDDDKYKGKILIYNLTRDELEEERDVESKKETYLKLPYKCESCIKGFDHEVTLSKHHEKQHRQVN